MGHPSRALNLPAVSVNKDLPENVPSLQEGAKGSAQGSSEKVVSQAKYALIQNISSTSTSTHKIDKYIIEYWKSLLSPDLKITAHDILEFYQTIPLKRHYDLFISVLVTGARKNGYSAANRTVSRDLIDICSYYNFRQYRKDMANFLRGINGSEIKSPEDLEDLIRSEACVAMYVILTMSSRQLNIPSTNEDIVLTMGSIKCIKKIDDKGFMSPEERTAYAGANGVLNYFVQRSYKAHGSPREFTSTPPLCEEETAESILLMWEQAFYELSKAKNKYRWRNSEKEVGERQVPDPNNPQNSRNKKGMVAVNHEDELREIQELENKLKDWEVAYISKKENWQPTQLAETTQHRQSPKPATIPPKSRPSKNRQEKSQYSVEVKGGIQVLDYAADTTVYDRIEAYMKPTGWYSSGYTVIVASGPPSCCIHRVERRRNVDETNSESLELKPEQRRALTHGRDPAWGQYISSVAFVDKQGDGLESIDPDHKPLRYPVTYVKIGWYQKADKEKRLQEVSWETRTDVRRMIMTGGQEQQAKDILGSKFGGMKSTEKWDYVIHNSAKILEESYMSGSKTTNESDDDVMHDVNSQDSFAEDTESDLDDDSDREMESISSGKENAQANYQQSNSNNKAGEMGSGMEVEYRRDSRAVEYPDLSHLHKRAKLGFEITKPSRKLLGKRPTAESDHEDF
ncbi:hypothetical protein AOL_s00091g35 [Orbilia oligospora ATCC 24927]|uniref:Uncharacterized protein n=1 Tax=Arthrobotrys oligospora (strain ATCC 24927 / CBS 115.81 / DSM 1491) TaxID=756982 RepID=G1XHY3_ARTOA|nr:hypothetical protein AOL_s00091g35 [Orbilia oligospora ATCC 24927]EGX47214.1 hypothetical protein AOL_s00091g35 [Orbilia oligospora ATCC 24927]